VTGTRLIAGRLFSDADGPGARPVAIVSESLARTLFSDGSALGRRLTFATEGPQPTMEIVGVVADTRPVDIAQPPNLLHLYQPVAQDPRPAATIALRTATDNPELAAPAVRVALEGMDPRVTVREMASADALVDSIGSQVALVRRLLAAFAGLGAFLALVGIYGLTTRAVAQRTKEIGVRLAIGAQVQGVVRMLVASSLRAAAAGIVIGVGGGAVAARGLGSVFPGMQVNAPAIVIGTIAVLAGIAVGVCFLSARRVATIDPVVALRAE
jgi:ABC-type antimicrobial peptide transport system permease subunit